MFRLTAVLLLSVAGLRTAEANPEKTFILPGGAEVEMVWIEPGTFVMGSDEQRKGSGYDSFPSHLVVITRGFWIGKYELTQGQWESVVNADVPEYVPLPGEGRFGSSQSPGPDYPATMLSPGHLSRLLDKMNAAEGFPDAPELWEMKPREMVWRLPTEAEWEYACRGGTKTKWFFGDDPELYDEYAWYTKDKELFRVGSKKPNPWGLHDMYGNAAEWCMEYYAPYSSGVEIDPLEAEGVVISSGNCLYAERECRVWVIRGGAPDHPSRVWSAFREDVFCAAHHYSGFHSGARLVRNAPEKSAPVAPESWGQIKKKWGLEER